MHTPEEILDVIKMIAYFSGFVFAIVEIIHILNRRNK